MDKAQTLLKLATGGILTEGRLSAKARELILGYLSKPGFLTGYMAAQTKDGETPDSEKLMAELMETLGKAGHHGRDGTENRRLGSAVSAAAFPANMIPEQQHRRLPK